MGNRNLFSSKHYFLVLNLNKSVNAINIFKRVNLNIAVNLIVAVQNGEEWTLFEVYNPSFKNKGTLRVRVVAYYSKHTGLQFGKVQPKYVRRRNMEEVHFRSQIVVRF